MRQYKLTLNSNSYEIIVKESTLSDAVVVVNGKEYTVSIDEIKNLAIPGLMPSSDELKAVPTAAKQVGQKTKPKQTSGNKSITAPIPGLIKGIFVKEGDKVTAGQKILVMEAMKMENVINSNADGVVKKILVGDGDNVNQDQELITIE